MKDRRHDWLTGLTLLAVASLPVAGRAQEASKFVNNFDETPAEHQECMKTVYSRRDPRDQDWVHMHHYCQGLRFYKRAQQSRSDPALFNHNCANSLDGYEYVLRQSAKTFKMRPEVLVMKGRTLELMGRGTEAATAYYEALDLDPNFSMAYGALGNYLARTGQKADALKTLSEGLRRKPNNRYLQARYAAVSGSASPTAPATMPVPDTAPEPVKDTAPPAAASPTDGG